jgi:hypothetical protein
MERGGKGKHRGGMAPGGAESKEIVDGYAVSYVQRLIKCGKANCKKCSEPGSGHGPYWYKIYREPGGKIISKYHGKVAPEETTKEGD